MTRSIALTALLFALGCGEKDPYDSDSAATDDSAVTDDSATDDSGVEAQSIEGSWLSEGENVSPLLQAFNYASITADFEAGGNYTVEATDNDGAATAFSGTYTVDVTTVIPTIVLTQTIPSAATSEGIWQVEDGVLSYEVIQTTPAIGYTPPTPEGGFGSSAGAGLTSGDNVQVFVAN